MYNPNKSYYRDSSMKSIGKLEKLGVVRFHDTYKNMWKTRSQAKKLHGTLSLSTSLKTKLKTSL